MKFKELIRKSVVTLAVTCFIGFSCFAVNAYAAQEVDNMDESVDGYVYADGAKLYESMDEKSSIVSEFADGQEVVITNYTVDMETDTIWYSVVIINNGVVYSGYMPDTEVAMNTTNQVASYSSDGGVSAFPESYQTALAQLHELHPNWVFEPFYTGITWSEAFEQEMVGGRNLVPDKDYTPTIWKNQGQVTMQSGSVVNCYDANSGKYTIFSDPYWIQASRYAVRLFMDPRQFLTEDTIFQFEKIAYNGGAQTVSVVESLLKGTFMYQKNLKGTNMTYAEAFVKIGSELNLNPLTLAARIRQEQGVNGDSALISGTVQGYEGYYNYFNIQASGVTREEIIANGMAEAKSNGWNSRYAALYGGSAKVAEKYVFAGQNTLYLQKFDVDNTANGMYWHQYMQNLQAADSEGTKVYNTYNNAGILNSTFVFRIPVYDNMPVADPGVSEDFTGLYCINNEWKYIKNGDIDEHYTGMAENQYGWWYFTDGSLNWNYTGMAENEYGWWYFTDGRINWTYTGLGRNAYGLWYYNNGQLAWNFTGMVEVDYKWYYVSNGKAIEDYTGMAENQYGWWYFNQGDIDWNYTGMAENQYGWWYFNNGRINWDYTGWSRNVYGNWYFSNGILQWN